MTTQRRDPSPEQQRIYDLYRHTAQVHEAPVDALELLDVLLSSSSGQPWTKDDLVFALAWPADGRKVRKAAELARRAGIPVISSSGAFVGYGLATSAPELEEFIAAELTSRIDSLEAQRSALSLTARHLRAGTTAPRLF